MLNATSKRRAYFVRVIGLLATVLAHTATFGTDAPAPEAAWTTTSTDLKCKFLQSWVAVDDRTAWAACGGLRRHRLLRIDPREMQVVAEIGIKSGGHLVAVREDAVWVTYGNFRPGVHRIDPVRNELISTARFVGEFDGALTSFLADDDSLWLTTTGGSVVRVHQKTLERTATVRVGHGDVRAALGKDTVWAMDVTHGTLSRIDSSTGRLVATIPIGVSCDDLGWGGPCHAGPVIGENAIWVASFFEGTVSRIDPVSNRVSATIPVGPRPSHIGIVDASVLVRTGRGALEIDPRTNRVSGRESEFDPPRIHHPLPAVSYPHDSAAAPEDPEPGAPQYRQGGERVDLEFLTPPVLRALAERDGNTPHETHMGITRFTPGKDFFRWSRYGGSAAVVIIQAVPKIRKSYNLGGLAWGDIGALFNPKDRIFEPDFGYMRLLRDGVEVPPVDPRRPCGRFIVKVLYPEGDEKWQDQLFGCYGSYAYDPEVFLSSSTFTLEVFTGSERERETFVIGTETIDRIRSDFRAYFEKFQ